VVQQVELIANKKGSNTGVRNGESVCLYFLVTNSSFGVIFMIYHPVAGITVSFTTDHNEC